MEALNGVSDACTLKGIKYAVSFKWKCANELTSCRLLNVARTLIKLANCLVGLILLW